MDRIQHILDFEKYIAAVSFWLCLSFPLKRSTKGALAWSPKVYELVCLELNAVFQCSFMNLQVNSLMSWWLSELFVSSYAMHLGKDKRQCLMDSYQKIWATFKTKKNATGTSSRLHHHSHANELVCHGSEGPIHTPSMLVSEENHRELIQNSYINLLYQFHAKARLVGGIAPNQFLTEWKKHQHLTLNLLLTLSLDLIYPH